MIATIAIVLLWFIAGLVLGHLVGKIRGEQRGRDLQRVEDVIESWKWMPERDARGRFKHKERHA